MAGNAYLSLAAGNMDSTSAVVRVTDCFALAAEVRSSRSSFNDGSKPCAAAFTEAG